MGLCFLCFQQQWGDSIFSYNRLWYFHKSAPSGIHSILSTNLFKVHLIYHQSHLMFSLRCPLCWFTWFISFVELISIHLFVHLFFISGSTAPVVSHADGSPQSSVLSIQSPFISLLIYFLSTEAHPL